MGVHEQIRKEVERVGYEIIAIKPTENENVKVIHAFSEKNKEYVTWIYNFSMGGLFSGRYFSYFMKNNKKEKEHMFKLSHYDWDNRQ